MKINDQTKLTGIIGYPLQKTLSPVIQNAAFKSLALNWAYVPMPVAPENLEKAIEGLKSLGFIGINVTMPHKEAVIPLLDDISDYAKQTGAVNTLIFKNNKIYGDNTDGIGFLRALKEDGHFDPTGKSAVILGAGGAARSIASVLVDNKIRSLTIVNRNTQKAKNLIEDIATNYKDCNLHVSSFNGNLPKIIDSTELIVNSTPVGWNGELVVDPGLLHQRHLVVDLVYVPEETRLLKEAKARKAKILSGKLMLLYQGAASFEIWTGEQAPVEIMRSALDRSLSSYSRR